MGLGIKLELHTGVEDSLEMYGLHWRSLSSMAYLVTQKASAREDEAEHCFT